MIKKWFIRGFIATFCIFALLLGSGFIYEAIESHRARDQFPPLGKMVSLKDGRKIQLDCRGSGSPIVVFEAGGDTMGSLSWAAVQDEISRFSRTCAYSRSGIMWSDDRKSEASSYAIAHDLHELLQISEEKPPYVLVGHSMGGLLITNYTKYFGGDVVGLVFVDASHPDQFTRLKNAIRSFPDAKMSSFKTFIMMIIAKAGILRVGYTLQGGLGLPEQPIETIQPAIAYASTSSGYVKEMEMLQEYLKSAKEVKSFQNRPLFVLTAMKPLTDYERMIMGGLTTEDGKHSKIIWKELQDELAGMSSNSRHELIMDSGHYIQFERPDAVTSAVKAVLKSIRAKKNL